NGLHALVQAKVLFLFFKNVLDGLILVVEAIELGHARLRLGVINPEFLLGFSFLVAAFEKVVPLVESGKRLRNRIGSGGVTGAHGNLLGIPCASRSLIRVPGRANGSGNRTPEQERTEPLAR